MTGGKTIRIGILALSTAAILAGCQSSGQKQAKAACDMCGSDVAKAPTTAPAPTYAKFGAPPRLTDADSVAVEKVLASPDQYKDKFVRLTGTVDKVCSRKGCWLTLRGPDEKGEALFVKFQDPPQGRLIPMDAMGKPAIVEGIVHVKEIPEDTARDYAQESGATPEQLTKIVGPQKQITVSSPGAQVAGVKNEQEGKAE